MKRVIHATHHWDRGKHAEVVVDVQGQGHLGERHILCISRRLVKSTGFKRGRYHLRIVGGRGFGVKMRE